LIAVSSLLLGCAGSTPPEKLYPVGTERDSLLGKGLEPMESESKGPGAAPSPPVASVLRERGLQGRVSRYDVFWVPRGALGMGVYWDYVFYDERDRVLYVMRRFLD
jgi:hypothetical protein